MKRILLAALSLSLLILPGRSLVHAGEQDVKRLVYLASGLHAEQFMELTANVAASRSGPLVLLDAPASRPYLRTFLEAHRPTSVVPVGVFAGGSKLLTQSLGMKLDEPARWDASFQSSMRDGLFDKADEIVVCVDPPRRLLLQAACLAGALESPLFVLTGKNPFDQVESAVSRWKVSVVHAVGKESIDRCRNLAGAKIEAHAEEEAIVAAYLNRLSKKGPIETLVVANPADVERKMGGMSILSPYVAIERRAPLLLTAADGRNAGALILAALKDPRLARAENVILVGNLQAIPMEARTNPLAGKDEEIHLEPPGLKDGEPFSFATGRLFHTEPGIVTLMLARRRLIAEAQGRPKAMVVSNPGDSLPLLEAISRNTAQELRNAGFETTAMFNRQVDPELLRKLLPRQDLFLWEGHHSTLVSHYGVPSWPEPMRPSLVFLQSCLALMPGEAHPFLRRGAVAVVGSPSRTYSASGGTLALAYFDALAYDQKTLGGALRQAKNFLLAYADLKEKRLGEAAKLGGASRRSAWAFSLWGDPTIKLPAPKPPENALPTVRAIVKGDKITLRLPEATHEEIKSENYRTKMWPNARLAGYLTKGREEDEKRLLPFLFAEIHLPSVKGTAAPRLSSKLPADRWVLLWDSRLSTGYLLVLPRSTDKKQIQFTIE